MPDLDLYERLLHNYATKTLTLEIPFTGIKRLEVAPAMTMLLAQSSMKTRLAKNEVETPAQNPDHHAL